ncbi:MAG: hypothetical protein ABI461_07145 [Polyangiaceae bacterium]
MASALSFRATAAFLAVSTVTLLAASALAVGCSSSSDAAGEPDAASNVCPTTLTMAIGQACDTPAPCVVGFECPSSLNEIATCNCVNKTWTCVDGHTNPITDPAAKTNCTALGGGNDKACPATEDQASFAVCGTPGLLCSYVGKTCPSSQVANTDQCQCGGNNTDGGLEFRCDSPSCNVPPSDAGIPPADASDAG